LPNRLTKNFIDAVSKRVKIVDLLDLTALDPDKLTNQLLLTKKDKFASNEFYLASHDDCDYYLPGCPYGISIFNFVRTFQSLDISLSRVILVTNHIGLLNEFKFLINEEDHCDLPVIIDTCLSAFDGLGLDNFDCRFSDININKYDIIKHGLCMMGLARNHRNALYNFLKDNNHLDKISTSFKNL